MLEVTRLGHGVCDGLEFIRHMVVYERKGYPQNAKFDQSWALTRIQATNNSRDWAVSVSKRRKAIPRAQSSTDVEFTSTAKTPGTLSCACGPEKVSG